MSATIIRRSTSGHRSRIQRGFDGLTTMLPGNKHPDPQLELEKSQKP